MKLLIGLSIICFTCIPMQADPLKGEVELDDAQITARLRTLTPKWDASGLVEHCVCMNPSKVQAVQVDRQWKLVDDINTITTFGNDMNAANAALQVAKFYGFTQACWAGRSNGSDLHEMRYFKNASGAPQGSMPDEDAISIDPSIVTAQQINGTWKVISSDKWLLDYGSDHEAAEQAAEVIQLYGFRYQCFVGNPGRAMMYFRR